LTGAKQDPLVDELIDEDEDVSLSLLLQATLLLGQVVVHLVGELLE